MQKNLTQMEQTLKDSLFKSAAGNGHDFGFMDEAEHRKTGFSGSQIGALLVSLQKKGWIQICPDDPCVKNCFIWTSEARIALEIDGNIDVEEQVGEVDGAGRRVAGPWENDGTI